MSSAGEDPEFQRLRRSEHVVSSRLGDVGLLVHLKTNQIFELNSTGLRVWELIGDGLEFEEVVGLLGSEFDVELEQLRREVADLVSALRREGLLDVGGQG